MNTEKGAKIPRTAESGNRMAMTSFCDACGNYMTKFVTEGDKCKIQCRICDSKKEIDANQPIYVRPDPAAAREILVKRNKYLGQDPRLAVIPGKKCPACGSGVRKFIVDQSTLAYSLACRNLECGQVTPAQQA